MTGLHIFTIRRSWEFIINRSWDEMQRLSFYGMFKISAYWFAYNFLWGALLAIVLPSQVKYIVGDGDKSAALGAVLSIGAIMAMVITPLFGAISDRTRIRLGRRRPYIVFGVLLGLFPLYWMATTEDLFLLLLAYLLLQFAINITGAAHHGLIPDLVPAEQRGVMASFMGVMTLLGTAIAVILAGMFADQHQYEIIYLVIALILLVCMVITVMGVKEQQYTEKQPFTLGSFIREFYISPRKFPDFAWMLLSTFLLLLGFYSINNYLQYYLEDVLGSTKPAEDTMLVGIVMLVGATLISMVAGKLSDWIGRRWTFAIAAIAMGLTAVVFLFAPSFSIILLMGVSFGIGYGTFTSVQWAIATDTLPNIETASGKDLGIWNLATTLPQVVAPLLGAVWLSGIGKNDLLRGYQFLYISVVIFLLLSAITVFRIRKVR